MRAPCQDEVIMAHGILMPGLERRLRAEITGDVLFDRFSRGRYATDASTYQIMPLGVVVPRTLAEVERAIALARDDGAHVLARGGLRSHGPHQSISSLSTKIRPCEAER
jgi:FAD/FMN-containing dehydrogenase